MDAKQKKVVDYEGMRTSELIDLMDGVEDGEYDKLYDELSDREFFKQFQEQITENDKFITGQQKALDKLKKHQHDKEGKLLVPL